MQIFNIHSMFRCSAYCIKIKISTQPQLLNKSRYVQKLNFLFWPLISFLPEFGAHNFFSSLSIKVHLGLPAVLLEDVFTIKLLALVRNNPRQFEQQPADMDSIKVKVKSVLQMVNGDDLIRGVADLQNFE